MRKIFAILTALLLVSCSMNHDEVVVAMKATQSTKISKEQALKNLYSELKFIDEGTRAEGTPREVKSIKPLVGAVTRSGNALDNDLLYIVEFGEGQGSAVVAADTRLKPVIAVLDSDVLTAEDFANEDMEDISAYMASMITNYAESAVSVNSTGLIPIPGNTVVDTIYTVNVPALLNTKWHQDSPYNNLCLDTDGEKIDAGCAAIAIAQFAYYHKSPDTINGYNVDWDLLADCEYVFGGNFNGGTIGGGGIIIFDPNFLANREVAKFVYNIGVTAGINYSSGYPGASEYGMLFCLDELGYNCTLTTYNNSNIRDIVEDNKPVIVVGYNSVGSAHAWVVDGWKQCVIRTTTVSEMPEGPVGSVSPEIIVTDSHFDRIHCNFGWGGQCDGYYFGDVFDCREINTHTEPNSGDIPSARPGLQYCFNTNLQMFSY